MMRFDRFTERAQDAAARAYEILQRYGHNQVDTEHIVMALLEQPDGTVPQLLETLSVDQALVKNRLEEVLHASPKGGILYGEHTGQVFITPRVKRIIDLANEEANRLKDEYISTEHIFLAILSERNTAVARILAEAGVTKERVRAVASEVLKEKAGESNPLKAVRRMVELPFATVLDLIDQLSIDDARQVYERLRKRFER